MKIRLLTLTLLALSMATQAQQPNDVLRKIFVYSPDKTKGLHLATQEEGIWKEVGQLCSSDYSTWGVEKRMYHCHSQ